MPIHISSGQMTSTPDYNIKRQNKLSDVGFVSKDIVKTQEYFFNQTFNESNVDSYDNGMSFIFNDYTKDHSISFYDSGLNTYFIVFKYIHNQDNKLFNRKLPNDSTNIFLDISYSQSNGKNVFVNNFSILPTYYQLPEDVDIQSIDLTNLDIAKQYLPTNKYASSLYYTNVDYAGFDFIFAIPIGEYLGNNTYNLWTISMYGEVYDRVGIDDDGWKDIYRSENFYTINDTDNSGEDFNLYESELLQNQSYVTIGGQNTSLPLYLQEKIRNDWVNGRQTMSLTCIYGKYYSYDPTTLSKDSTEVVLNGKDGKMIEVGDVVVPTRLYTNQITNSNYELPIAVDKNGDALEFEVLSSEIEFNNGKLVAHLKLMEVK